MANDLQREHSSEQLVIDEMRSGAGARRRELTMKRERATSSAAKGARSRKANRSARIARAAGWLGLGLGAVVVGRRALQRGDGVGRDGQREGKREVVKAITINRSPDEVYRFWRRLENLPRFMANLESVREIDERRSRWSAKAPAGTRASWDAEIVDDRPGERIAWRSLEGADVENAGVVSFRSAPGERGTEVRVDMHYDAPAGRAGVVVAKLFRREPGQEVSADLRRLKQVMETGQVVHSDATVHRGPHPARPPRDAPDLDDDSYLASEASAGPATSSSTAREELR